MREIEEWAKSPMSAEDAVRYMFRNVEIANKREFSNSDGDIYVVDAEIKIIKGTDSDRCEFRIQSEFVPVIVLTRLNDFFANQPLLDVISRLSYIHGQGGY